MLQIISVIGLIVFLIVGFVAAGDDRFRLAAIAFVCCFVCLTLAFYSSYKQDAGAKDRCSERCGELRHVACGSADLGRYNDDEREFSVCEAPDGLVLKLAPKP